MNDSLQPHHDGGINHHTRRGGGTVQPCAASRSAAAKAAYIQVGMSAERSFSNSAEPRTASILATVSGVTLSLPRYHSAEIAAPAGSPANCSSRRVEV